MGEQWSREKAWAWYNARPWMRGCNFMSSDCRNRVDQWQEEGFEKRLQTADRDLALAAETGFNSIRIIPEFIVWDQQHDGFMERFDRYLATAWKHGISAMVVFGNDCCRPKDEYYVETRLGEQPCDMGYHGGKKISQHQGLPSPGYHPLDDPDIAPRYDAWVREMIETYKDDPRVCMWDLFNEPGNSHREELTAPHVKRFFEIARAIAPSQPLTACVWRNLTALEKLSPIEKWVLENADIVSYHNYNSYAMNVEIIRNLKKLGRPLINTEWLGRGQHNTVQEMFPLFYLEKIGCWNWGFVAGLNQTFEPWNATWERYERGENKDYDFTKWFHDLYRPSLRPYDPHETELIRHFCDLADADEKGK